MADRINISARLADGYVRCTLTGRYHMSLIKQVIDDISMAAAAANQARVLIDTTAVEGPLTEIEKYLVGKQMAETWSGRLRAAVLERSDRITKLAENTAVNRGAIVLVTGSEEEAVRWLVE